MKQIMQDLAQGATFLIDTPTPQVPATGVRVMARASLISAGTERMLAEFGKASLISKARQQPDRVKQVLQKMGTDGVFATLDAVRSKLGQPLPLGYSHVGVVEAVGARCSEFAVGDRVVSNGPHAEVVAVGRNLCARIPDGVSDEDAAFTVIASIGLQGIRLADPKLGESVAVIGAGLIGLLTIQMLRANGCRVLAVDTNAERLKIAERYGADTCNPAAGGDPVAAAIAMSGHGQGVDAVIITASAKGDSIANQSAQMTRRRGRIVLVGVVDLNLDRANFYEKEQTFQVSCSYGPGRYDPAYEGLGQDYPLGFVRWTEQRNFTAILEMMRSGALVVGDLITHRVPLESFETAYAALSDDPKALAIVLQYPQAPSMATRVEARRAGAAPQAGADPVRTGKGIVGVIGAGNFAARTMLPVLKKAGATLKTIVAPGGLSAAVVARKVDFDTVSSDTADIMGDPAIDTVFVLSRHSSHATLTAAALGAGKHAFVEKPLAIDGEGLAMVRAAHEAAPDRLLMVGFNRRFAPMTQTVRAALAGAAEPSALIMTVNAGKLPSNHWTLDPGEGGRIIGEACHFVDLARFLIGAPITSVRATGLPAAPGTHPSGDSVSIALGFADGSIATILYLANGSQGFDKERIEVFNGGRILRIENFRRLVSIGWPGVKSSSGWSQDKGHAACATAFLDAVRGGLPSPIPAAELFEVHDATIEAARLAAEPR